MKTSINPSPRIEAFLSSLVYNLQLAGVSLYVEPAVHNTDQWGVTAVHNKTQKVLEVASAPDHEAAVMDLIERLVFRACGVEKVELGRHTPSRAPRD